MQRSLIYLLIVLSLFSLVFSAKARAGEDEILKLMEKRYEGKCFFAYFKQKSRLFAMDISEEAKGKLILSHPGKMRWEYEDPEPRLIISDGLSLWIYSPMDNELLKGEAEAYFGKGKSGHFFYDMGSLNRDFTATKLKSYEEEVLFKLKSKSTDQGLEELFLSLEKETGRIISIESFNTNGDSTKISFYKEKIYEDKEKDCGNENFIFIPPEGTEELNLAQ